MSILGIGVDVCEVARICSSLEKHGDLFAEKILHQNEKLCFQQTKQKARYLAKRFAAKEAFAKALGTGISQGVSLPFIEVSNDDLGKPQITLHQATKTRFDVLGGGAIHLSISDERQFAVAQVVIERK